MPLLRREIQIPTESTRPSSRDEPRQAGQPDAGSSGGTPEGETAEEDSSSGPLSIAPPTPPGDEEAAAAGPTPIVSAPVGPSPTAWPGATAPAAVDPITEAGNVVWYVRPPSGGQFGPAGGDIMRTWLAEGRVSADSLVWREGWRDWREAAGVFPILRPEQTSPAANPAPASNIAPVPIPVPAAATGNAPPMPPRPLHAKARRANRTKDILVIVTLSAVAVALVIVLFCLELYRK